MALKGGTRFAATHADVFPAGCKYLPESIGEVEDYDPATKRRTPAIDKQTGKRVYQVRVHDMDPELGQRAREVAVKISADFQPVPPVGPFEDIEFIGLTVTPYINASNRMAYSFRATGMRAASATDTNASKAVKA